LEIIIGTKQPQGTSLWLEEIVVWRTFMC